MLAPRKTLWSTPQSAVDAALLFADLQADDIVYDVGCGDGRVLIHMASKSISQSTSSLPEQQHHRCHKFIGIEISSSRAQEARDAIEAARNEKLIPHHVSIEIRCANALEIDYSDATVVFLYLVPRGLRLIRPILWGNCKDDSEIESSDDVLNDIIAKNEECGKSIAPQIQQQQETLPKRIISYMNPIEGETIVRKEYCKVGNVEGAAFPIFLYHIK